MGKVVLLEQFMAEVLADFIPIFDQLGIRIGDVHDLIQTFGSQLPFIIMDVLREFAEKGKLGVPYATVPGEAGGETAEAALLYLLTTGQHDKLREIAREVLAKLVEKLKKREITVPVKAKK